MSLVFGQEHVLCGSFNRATDLKIGNGWTEVSYIKLSLSLLKRFHIWIDNVGRFLVTLHPATLKISIRFGWGTVLQEWDEAQLDVLLYLGER